MSTTTNASASIRPQTPAVLTRIVLHDTASNRTAIFGAPLTATEREHVDALESMSLSETEARRTTFALLCAHHALHGTSEFVRRVFAFGRDTGATVQTMIVTLGRAHGRGLHYTR